MSTIATLILALGFSAQELCSCVFVTGHTEAECRQYVSIEQLKPRLNIDRKLKQVKASYYVVFSETAVYEGDKAGCRLK